MEVHKHSERLACEKRASEDIESACPGFISEKSIRIPKKRVAEVINFREEIERIGKVKIEVSDEIRLSGESYDVFAASSLITAIGRGFDYSEASSLLDDSLLYVIPIVKDRKNLIRIRARLIGRNGKVRKKIEELTNTKISIYGKTVSIIGKDDDLEKARVAVEKIIEGKTHTIVFKFLEAKNKG